MSSRVIKKYSYSDIVSFSNEAIGERGSGKKTYKIGFLRSFSVEVMEPLLKGLTTFERFNLEYKYSNFNNILQDSFNLEKLFSGDLDLLIVVWRKEDIGYGSGGENNQKESSAEEGESLGMSGYISTTLENLSGYLKNNPSVKSVVHTFLERADEQNENDISEANRLIVEFCESNDNAFLFEIDEIQKMLGDKNVFSSKMENIAKFPFSREAAVLIAKRYVAVMRFLFGYQIKCLSIDLDNTVWNGILGEDGDEYVHDSLKTHSGYRHLWEFMDSLSKKGIILAINSKNNREDVEGLFQKYEMPLKLEDFIVRKINWQPKSQNLKEMAEELNIGFESIIHLDDSEFECEEIIAGAPGATVVLVAEDDPYDSVKLMEEYGFFHMMNQTGEDSARVESYKAERIRKNEQSKYTDIDSFIKSLSLNVKIQKVTEKELDRVSQLFLKTNQFNMTTKRYSKGELREFIGDDSHKLYCFSLMDKFGDYGIIGSYLIRVTGEDWHIDSFLMSCRAIGRKVEYELLNYIVSNALKDNTNKIIAYFNKTKKNEFLENFYPEEGFQQGDRDDETMKYEILSEDYKARYKDLIELVESE
ncbi:MAG: HAD-IIIC family phosphatase [Candidatus Marinimicrobia bacterium]|nr:HAD-IIIC family phosphatase [Candidatus Neomarinimicrobiota bacterium]